MKNLKSWKNARIAVAIVVMTVVVLAFAGVVPWLAPLLHAQFGLAMMRSFAALAAGALATVIGIAVVTVLFGRFYCSMLCPLGILQDICGWISRRKGQPMPNFAKTRYAVAGIVFGLLICGVSAGFLLLDPYSSFGRIFGGFTLGAVLPLVPVIILAVFKKRIYCTAICPAGTLLGILAKYGVFKLAISDKCVKCGNCVTVCPAGCIDPNAGTVDNERCVRCMNCVSACPTGGIRLVRRRAATVSLDVSRRTFLINGGVLIAGLATGVVLAKTGMAKLGELAKKFKILPPGAGNAARFNAKCTACQLCTANCPAKIIVPASGGFGPVSLDLRRGACQFDCNRCSQICPTGAILPLTLAAKQRTKIAEAKFNPQNCIVFQNGEPCGKCAAVCPVHAITLRKNGTPRPVNTAVCIGCGACQALCPAPDKAMTVVEIEKQLLLEV